MADLTVKQQRFVDEYIVDGNATQAAIRAGYSSDTAEQIGYQLLQKTSVAEAIEEALSKQQVRTNITADRVLEELGKLAFSNMLDYMTVTKDGLAVVDLSELTREQAAAIQEITVDQYFEPSEEEEGRTVKKVKIKMTDKKGALELLGKHFKLFTDRKEITGLDGGRVPVEIVISDETEDSDEEE